MSVTPVPSPSAGTAPFPSPDLDPATAPVPEVKLTPNPYAIPDSVVFGRAGSEADRQMRDVGAAVQHFWNAAIGDDLHAATDANQPIDVRLLHAGLAGATILTLPGAPEALGLKLAAKETLKGGVEQLTFHAVGKAALAGGKLVLQDGVKLTPDEAKIAAEFAQRGHEVIVKAPSAVGRSADFLIDGTRAELKTIAHVKAGSAGEAITNTVTKATKQAKHVVIDARNQRGLTEVNARFAVTRAVRNLPKSRISQVQLLGRDGNQLYEFVVTKK